MSENAKSKRIARQRRAARVRRRVQGTPSVPRLSVFRSSRNIFAQLIDDESGATLAAASSLKVSAEKGSEDSAKIAAARAVGTALAQAAQEKGITAAVFDRAGYKFHGRVAALAAGARDAGLKF